MKKGYENFRRNLLVDRAGKVLVKEIAEDVKVSRASTEQEIYLVSIKGTETTMKEIMYKLTEAGLKYVRFDRCL